MGQRALRGFKSLPPTVWNDPNLPMTRKEWEGWLDAMTTLMKDRSKTAAAGGPQE